MIEFLGFLLIIAGCVLFAFAWRGRLVNTHPHCRGCGFDLDGLQLEQTPNCPECGRLITTSKAAIRYGKRQSRRWLGAFACVVLLLGINGMAWKPISRVSGLSNVNWYEHLPEPMLVSMATGGNTKALDTLHARLIPGEVSDEALDSLIDHAMAMLDDESVAWDERWGDVLIYGILENELTSDELDRYLRSTQEIVLKAHDRIGSNETKLHFHVGTGSTGLGSFDSSFLHRWRSRANGFSRAGNSVVLRLNRHQFPIAVNDEPIVREPRTGLSGGSGFTTRKGDHSLWHLDEEFPLTQNELTIKIAIEFELESDGKVLHTWEEERHHTFTRLDHPIERNYAADDLGEIETFIESLSVKSVSIPVNLKEGYKHKRTRYFGYQAVEIDMEGEHEISLVGDLYFQLGTQRMDALHRPISKTPREDGKVKGGLTVFYQNGGLDTFKRHQFFLMQAVLNEKVDIVFVPNAEACKKYPQVTAYLATPLIFRDVPIKRYHPQYGRAGDTDGNTWMQWQWREVDSTQSFEPVYAEPISEEDL